MNIEFYSNNKNLLIYNSELHAEIIKYLEDNNVESILFDYSELLKNEKNLAFFNEVGENYTVRNQFLNRPDDVDSSELHTFSYLNTLFLGQWTPKMEIDFSKFPHLSFCACEWHNKMKNISSLTKLKNFNYLSGYKPKSKDLQELATLKELEYLKLLGGNFSGLNGLNKLDKLKTLQLYSNRNLTVERNVVMSSVEELHIDACKQIGPDFYKSFPNVKILFFDNNVDIPSLKPILDGLEHLEEINVCGANILEEDNSYWLNYKNIKRFNFKNRRHHKLKNTDFPNYPHK